MTRSADDPLARCFDFVSPPDDPADLPAHFCFCLPNGLALAKWPGFPRAACVETGRAAAGRGLSLAQCRASALGEAIELASACLWGDEPILRSTWAEIDADALDPDTLSSLTEDQFANRDQWNASLFGQIDWFPPPAPQNRPIDWIAGTDAVTGDSVWVPADFVFVGKWEDDPANAVARADTSGCASAVSMSDAKLHALCELIERDATARWWHCRTAAPEAESALIADAPDLHRFLTTRRRITRLIDLGNEFGPHTIGSLSWEPDRRRVACGFATRFDRAEAAVSACIEMMQTELGIGQRERAGDPVTRDWLANVTSSDLPKIASGTVAQTPRRDDEDTLNALIAALARSGLTPVFIDLTRPAFARPAVRAIVPGLCPGKPRFGSARMPKDKSGRAANPRPLAV